MPLERSHVIVICSVSPLIVGLAAYYWYRSRKTQQDEIVDNTVNSPATILENSDTTDMTRQKRDKINGAAAPLSQGHPVAKLPSKLGCNEPQSKEHKPTDNVSARDSPQTVSLSGNTSDDLFQENRSLEDRVIEEEATAISSARSDQSNQSDNGSSGPRIDSNFSDTHTEVSADSALGVSSDSIIFKFDFPSDLVGLLIGNHGRNVKMLQEKSGARVRIERSNFTSQYQVCVVEGSSHSVDVALELIRDRFPHLDLSQLTNEAASTGEISSAAVPIPQLRIPQHTFSDVCISTVVTAGNVYLQQPTHPYFRELELLTQQMNAVYSDFGAPALPEPIPVGVICAAPWIDQIAYCRALILSVNESSGMCQVRYVDHGSTVELPTYSLRQIRSDFLRLPFQATDCCLSNIAPLDGQDHFSVEAAAYLHKITEGFVLLCWVHGFDADGKPKVELYLRHGSQKVSVNKLLVENGFAKWSDTI